MNAVTSWYNLGYSKRYFYGVEETDHHRLHFGEAALLVVSRKKIIFILLCFVAVYSQLWARMAVNSAVWIFV
jgi:hypothetical protein